jgi:hypothetical protein
VEAGRVKQHLYLEDLDRLTRKQKAAWWTYLLGEGATPKDPGSAYNVALGTTIGRMIDFLMETNYYHDGQQQHWLDISGLDHVIEDRTHAGADDTLVGTLWTSDDGAEMSR